MPGFGLRGKSDVHDNTSCAASQRSDHGRPSAIPAGGEKLPEPPFPRRPELLTSKPLPQDGGRHWTLGQIYHFQGIHGNFE
jgi:hypothetical protein